MGECMGQVTRVRSASRLVRWGILLLAACDWNMMGPTSCARSVTVSPPYATVAVGQTVQLYATVRDTDGNVISGVGVTWMSDNTAVATVEQTGLVTGVAVGQTVVTATSDEQAGSSQITVTATAPPPPPSPPPAVARGRSP